MSHPATLRRTSLLKYALLLSSSNTMQHYWLIPSWQTSLDEVLFILWFTTKHLRGLNHELIHATAAPILRCPSGTSIWLQSIPSHLFRMPSACFAFADKTHTLVPCSCTLSPDFNAAWLPAKAKEQPSKHSHEAPRMQPPLSNPAMTSNPSPHT